MLLGGIQIDALNLAAGAQLEIGVCEQHRQEHRLRNRFRVMLARVALTESAEYAGVELQSLRIGIRLTQIGRGLREWVITHAGSRLAK